MTASALRWPLFALIGLLVAVAVALLANQLVSKRIGISSEPVTAGESLSPKQARPARPPQRQSHAPPRTISTGPVYTGTVSSSTGSDNSPSDRSPADDSKQAPSTGGGSDNAAGHESGDD